MNVFVYIFINNLKTNKYTTKTGTMDKKSAFRFSDYRFRSKNFYSPRKYKISNPLFQPEDSILKRFDAVT